MFYEGHPQNRTIKICLGRGLQSLQKIEYPTSMQNIHAMLTTMIFV